MYNLDMGMWDTDQVTVRWSTQSFNGPLYEELSCEVFYASNISIHMIISSIMYTHRIYLGHCSQDRICYWQVGDAKEFKVATLQKKVCSSSKIYCSFLLHKNRILDERIENEIHPTHVLNLKMA